VKDLNDGSLAKQYNPMLPLCWRCTSSMLK